MMPVLLTLAQPMSQGDQREPGFPGLPLVGRGSFAMQTSIVLWPGRLGKIIALVLGTEFSS